MKTIVIEVEIDDPEQDYRVVANIMSSGVLLGEEHKKLPIVHPEDIRLIEVLTGIVVARANHSKIPVIRAKQKHDGPE